jgi:hypothetical protein
MKTKTRVRAGGIWLNHNETLVRDMPKATGLRVKTKLKADGEMLNHNEFGIGEGPGLKAK